VTAAGLWLAAATLLATAQAGTLEQATVRILTDETGATVDATYLISQPPEVVAFNAIRLPGRRFFLLDLPDRGPPAQRFLRPGLLRFAFTAQRRDTLAVGLRYRVEGPTDRIPIFVPEIPTAPPRGRIEILVAGVPPERIARDRVPRFVRLPDGTLRATPDHLPSLVAVVRGDGALPVPAVVQWVVVALAVVGTLGWAAWARRS